MTALKPTGVVSPDRTQLQVTDPEIPGGDKQPSMVTVPQYLASVDPKYLATHPWESTRNPWPQNEPAYRAGQGIRKVWDNLNTTDMGSGIVSGVAGAGGGLAASYLLDSLGYRLFGKKPMGVGGRTLSALAGALLAAGAQQHYRRSARDSVAAYPQPETVKMSFNMLRDDASQLMRTRQFLASQVMAASLPMDIKTQVLQMLDRLGGRQLVELSRFVAPIGGALAGVAIAKFFFGGSFLPQLIGGLTGGYLGNSALRPRLNATGHQML